MQSLVNAPVLALDLVRHPAGDRVCDALDRVLVLDAGDLAALARTAAGLPSRTAARRRLLAVADRAPRLSDALADTGGAFAGPLAPAPLQQTARRLAACLLGRLTDVHAMLLSSDPLCDDDAPLEAVGAALDAVTAVWSSLDPEADPADVATLLAPWQAGLALFPTATPLAVPTGATGSLLELLDAVARSTPEQWTELGAAHDALFDGLAWSTAVHEGCRAAAESSRTADVARWHLAAARTAHGTGHAGQGAGAMMAVVSAVQATCVRDLLRAETAASLTGACRAVFGWSG